MNTYLLRWLPEESDYSRELFLSNLHDVAEGDAVTMAWPVGAFSGIRYGDRFLLLDSETNALAMAGYFSADAIDNDDDPDQYYADIEPLVWVDTRQAPVLTLEDLKAAAPGFDWDSGQETALMPEADAAPVELLFMQYLYDNQQMFFSPAAAKAWDFDLENFETIPSTLQTLLKQRHGSTCERCGKQEKDVQEMAYHLILDDYSPEHPAPMAQHLHCLCNECWFGADE